MCKYDGEICITEFSSRKAKTGRIRHIQWSKFVKHALKVYNTKETMDEYAAMGKKQQTSIKDIGGFIGGELENGRRKIEKLINRTVLTLDLDHAKPGLQEAISRFGYACVIYSTHKHRQDSWRIRMAMPLAEPVDADEYELGARMVMNHFGVEQFDPGSSEPTRLMFWSSTSKDGEHLAWNYDGPWLDLKALLQREKPDWKDYAAWKEPEPVKQSRAARIRRLGDPREKTGPIGLFCRAYSVTKAIQTFLSDTYIPFAQNRYTYRPASTTGGLVIYDEDTYAYSNHASDPASKGRHLCNAFDLVRIHKFSALDEDTKDGTPVNKLPSWKAMCELVREDPLTHELSLQEDFNDDYELPPEDEAVQESDTDAWKKQLTYDKKGNLEPTRYNVSIILTHYAPFKGRIAYNEFSGRPVVLDVLPWDKDFDPVNGIAWDSYDDEYLQGFFQKKWGIRSKADIIGGMMITAKNHKFNPVRTYLDNLPPWDGEPRVETLLMTYLGAEDTPYIRAVTRKAFLAAFTRIYKPGTKFDHVVILSGPQGRGKSTLIAKMSMGWYLDSKIDIGNKEAYVTIQGSWFIEFGELASMKKTEIESIKAFMSASKDNYRAPYARWPEEHPRMCVFWGTTNDDAPLRDPTGNRRFWPVKLSETEPELHSWDLTEEYINQFWAEIKTYYEQGEGLELPPELSETARGIQADFTEEDPIIGDISAFLDIKISEDWGRKSKDDRRFFFGPATEHDDNEPGLCLRERICASEIWNEMFQRTDKMNRQDAEQIRAALKKVPGWKECKSKQKCGPYGSQRCFERDKTLSR